MITTRSYSLFFKYVSGLTPHPQFPFKLDFLGNVAISVYSEDVYEKIRKKNVKS